MNDEAPALTPVFPLGTVLFPGGMLALQIFEPRYVDMVRHCLREDSAFCVSLITAGTEVGAPAEYERIGCLARIVDWSASRPGILDIRSQGLQRARLSMPRTEKDGLARALAEPIADDDPTIPVPEKQASCTRLLEAIVDDLRRKDGERAHRLIAEPLRFDSAAWVSNRLCDFLPLPAPIKQRLMELTDPLARLTMVQDFLGRKGLI